MKIDTGKQKKVKSGAKRFHKITDFVVQKSSPQKESSDEAPVEQEAEAIVKFRQARAKVRGKSTYEDA